ncbi:MAG: DUF1819 family protein [Bacillota bacterium]|nr:DUF1819 family protein [Bacillota bacterium]
MAQNPYSLSFTTGTLMLTESVLLTELYIELGSWQRVREKVKQNNLLQGKTMKSTMTLMSEIISRLRFLSDEQLRRLTQAPEKDQKYILWLALCRRYQYIADFTVEVMGAAVRTPDKTVTRPDYQAFFDQKAVFYPRLQNLAESTQKTVANFIFRMAMQAGIMDGDGRLLPVIVLPENRLLFTELNNLERQYFPGLGI